MSCYLEMCLHINLRRIISIQGYHNQLLCNLFFSSRSLTAFIRRMLANNLRGSLLILHSPSLIILRSGKNMLYCAWQMQNVPFYPVSSFSAVLFMCIITITCNKGDDSANFQLLWSSYGLRLLFDFLLPKICSFILKSGPDS